eukprot:763695-Hanusia_phi.AAC.5
MQVEGGEEEVRFEGGGRRRGDQSSDPDAFLHSAPLCPDLLLKVELSYKAVATLHQVDGRADQEEAAMGLTTSQPAFVTPEFHVQRKALGGAETVK